MIKKDNTKDFVTNMVHLTNCRASGHWDAIFKDNNIDLKTGLKVSNAYIKEDGVSQKFNENAHIVLEYPNGQEGVISQYNAVKSLAKYTDCEALEKINTFLDKQQVPYHNLTMGQQDYLKEKPNSFSDIKNTTEYTKMQPNVKKSAAEALAVRRIKENTQGLGR